MFKIEFAGTGGALPLKERNLSSVLFSYAGRKIIFDVGEGTQQSLLKLHSGFVNIDIICLSHLHGDHVFGLPGLLCTMGMAKRTNDLLILAPKGSRQLLSQFVCLVGRQDFSVYVLEFNASNEFNLPTSNLAITNQAMPANLSLSENEQKTSPQKANAQQIQAKMPLHAKKKLALALQLSKFGYKIDLTLSDPELINPDNFYCLLAKRELTQANTSKLAKPDNKQANQQSEYPCKKGHVDMQKLFPQCNLFYVQEAPEQLLANSRLAKKLHKYENLRFTYAPNTPASLYISSAPQKHSVNCIAYRLDFYKAGRFHVDKAKALGIFQGFWSYLQNGYSISYALNKHAYKFTPANVTSPPVHLFNLAYVTDTRPLASNQSFLKDVQVLISEANYLEEGKEDLALKNRHMTLEEACAQASSANVKHLILTHFSASVTDPDLYKEKAKALFANSYLAHDLDSFTFVIEKSDNGSTQTAILTDVSNITHKESKQDDEA